MKTRIKYIIIFFLLFWILLLSRLYFISIKSNKYYQELAKRNVINQEVLTPTRGEIRDRSGALIAESKLGFYIAINAHLSKQSSKNELEKALKDICDIYPNFESKKLLKRYKKADSPYNHKPVKIIDFIPYDAVIEQFVTLSHNKSIVIKPASKRFYPFGDTASHVIGYVAKANHKDIEESSIAKYLGVSGKNGIEKYYDTILAGELGFKKVKVTATNRELATIEERQPTSSDIKLTIDMRLQSYIGEIFDALSGAVVVMDARDGSILAAGSYPEYDLNDFVQGISSQEWKGMIEDLNHPFTNKFIKGLYPPGSSTKPAVALSFLNSNLVSEDEIFLCTGALTLGKRKFRCWNSYGHGKVNLRRAISESCDDYFYKGGLRVGIDKISTDLTRYGFGEKTGVDLPNEFIGTVPSRNWKINKFGEAWYKGETLNTVIGQGNFLATPLQVANFTAMIATGKQVIPHFIKETDLHEIDYGTLDVFNTFERNKLPIIRKGMYDVCNAKRGTAYKYIETNLTIAGKTGTSQVIGIPQEEKERMSEHDLEYYQKSHAWFTTYGPYKNPQYIVTALIEHGGHGGSSAGKLVSKIYNKLIELKYIDNNLTNPHPNTAP